MNCSVSDCRADAVYKCEECNESKLLCQNHGEKHEEDQDHRLSKLSKSEISTLRSITVNSEIDDCISRISKDAQVFIKIIKKLTNEAIAEVREANKNITQISDFRPVLFDGNKVKAQMQQAKLLKPDIKVSNNEQVEDLLAEINKRDERIKRMTEIISQLRDELTQRSEPRTQEGRKNRDEGSLLDAPGEKRASSRSKDGGSDKTAHRRNRSDVEQDEKQKKAVVKEQRRDKGKTFVDFNSKTLDEKRRHVVNVWSFVGGDRSQDLDLLLSNNENYLFRCMEYFGL